MSAPVGFEAKSAAVVARAVARASSRELARARGLSRANSLSIEKPEYIRAARHGVRAL